MNSVRNKSYYPTFSATFVKNHLIKHDNENISASLALLDIYSKDDMNALQAVDKNWGKTNFGNSIVANFSWEKLNKNKDYKMRYYVLTTQKEHLEHLDANNVLALAQVQIIKQGKIILHFLQVKPEAQSLHHPSDYKGVGTAVLKTLQSVYDKIHLIAIHDIRVHHFYRRNGFKRMLFTDDQYYWSIGILGRMGRYFKSLLRK